jgi:hypothetical protein
MAPKTVQEAFKLKPEEVNALAILSGLEGYRGAGGKDVATVAANVLARRLKGNWGGVDIRNIAKAPGQYEAVFDYSMQQLADPAFGARVLGGQSEFERIRNIVNNPALVGEAFKKSKGAQSFRGVAAYGSKKPSDYMPVPGKSNYYFNPLDPTTYQKGVGMFNAVALPSVPAAPGPAAKPKPQELAGQNPTLLRFAQELFAPIFSPASGTSSNSTLGKFMNLLGTMGQ